MKSDDTPHKPTAPAASITFQAKSREHRDHEKKTKRGNPSRKNSSLNALKSGAYARDSVLVAQYPVAFENYRAYFSRLLRPRNKL